jgi:HK97 family phage prohead protease
MNIKSLYHGGHVIETKQNDRNGVPVGIVAGYIATWDVDRGDWSGIKDKFIPGAFKASIARHKKAGRQIRLKDTHGRTVGGFPIDTVKEDATGLYGIGEINLDVQQGKEVFALAKQGVISDFSIGWEPTADMTITSGVREIPKAEIWEGSLVSEPRNPKAVVIEVKSLLTLDERELEGLLISGTPLSNKLAKKFVSAIKAAGMLRDEPDGHRDDEAMIKEIYQLLQEFK